MLPGKTLTVNELVAAVRRRVWWLVLPPIAGFFGNAEIAPLRGENRLFTHTGVLALIGDGRVV